jgi:hypothetical protein
MEHCVVTNKFHPGIFTSKKTKPKKRIHILKSKPLVKTGCIIPLHYQTIDTFLFFNFHSQKYIHHQNFIQDRHAYLQKYKKTMRVEHFVQLETDFKRNIRAIRFHEKLKMAFLRVLSLWRQYKYGKRHRNSEDPFTLTNPIQAISVYDHRAKGCFIFEAKSLMRSFESYLFQNDWLFPQPQEPKNVLTNVNFTYPQIIKIWNEFRKYGAISWAIEAYKKCACDISKFHTIYKIALEIEGLKALLRNRSSNEFQTLLREFIEDHHIDYGKNFTTNMDTIFWAIEHQPRHEYIEKWVTLFEKFYTLKFTGDSGAGGKVQRVEIILQAKRLLQDYGSIDKLTLKKHRQRVKRLEENRSQESSISIRDSPTSEEQLPPLIPLFPILSNLVIPLGTVVHVNTDSEEVDVLILGDV